MKNSASDNAYALNNRAKRIKKINLIIKYLLLTVFAFIWVYPFLWMFSASFKSNGELFKDKTNLIPKELVVENFERAWKTANFSRYFVNTIFITVMTIIIVLLVTLMMGYILGRYKFKGKGVIMGVIAASMFIPMGFNLIPVFELISKMGLVNSLWGVILAEAGSLNVVFVLLFSSCFSQIPREISEAAEIDGCGFFLLFLKIMVPLSKPIIGSVLIMQFIWTWNAFMMPLVLTLNNASIRTLAVGLYSLKGELMMDWAGIAAGGSIALIPVIILFICLQKYFVNGIVGAVKG